MLEVNKITNNFILADFEISKMASLPLLFSSLPLLEFIFLGHFFVLLKTESWKLGGYILCIRLRCGIHNFKAQNLGFDLMSKAVSRGLHSGSHGDRVSHYWGWTHERPCWWRNLWAQPQRLKAKSFVKKTPFIFVCEIWTDLPETQGHAIYPSHYIQYLPLCFIWCPFDNR